MGLFKKKENKPSFIVDEVQKTLHKNLDFTATEQYKLLRTNLDFVLPAGEKCPIIGITSSTRGEGKSTTAINLSYVLAEKGSKVLLVDGDLRLPSIAKKMEMENKKGLTDLLMNKPLQLEEFRSSMLENWYILSSGEIPPNPSELLGSNRMESALTKLREMFDYIVIDLPPVNIVSDAMSIARLITGMLVVMREDYTERKELETCFRQLELSHVKILGCVMTYSKSLGASHHRYNKRYKKYKKYKYYGRYGKYGHYGDYGYDGGYGYNYQPEDENTEKKDQKGKKS